MIEIVIKEGEGTSSIRLIGKLKKLPKVTPSVGETIFIKNTRYKVANREFTYEVDDDKDTSLRLLTLTVEEV